MTFKVAQACFLGAASFGLLGLLSPPAAAEVVMNKGETPCSLQDNRGNAETRVPNSDTREYVLAMEESGELRDPGLMLEDGSFYSFYFLMGEAGQNLEAQVRSSGFQPVLLITHNDTEDVVVAAEGDEDGKIYETFTLPHEGLYVIVVKSATAGETGTFELSLGVER